MPTGPPLATAAEVAAFLGYETAEELDEPGLELNLELASNAVRDELGQRIDLAEGVEEVIGQGTDVILLPELPVVDVAGVTIPADAGGDDEVLTAAAGDWRLERGREARFAVLRRLGGNVWPRRPILVDYSHGYALEDPGPPVVPTEIPGGIRLVVIRLVVRNLTNPTGVRQESAGRYSATYDLTDVDKAELGPFYPGSKAGRR